METVEGIKARRGAVTGTSNHVPHDLVPAADRGQVPTTIPTEVQDGSALNVQSESIFDFDLSDPLWNLDWDSTVEFLGF